MKKITQFSVNYPVTISMIVMALILLGVISFGKLSINLFPDMNAPRVFIEIKVGEQPPEEIEKQFVENIESQAIRQKGVTQVTSICMVGAARITVEYNWNTDMDEAFLDLQKAMTIYNQNSEMDEFIITQHDPNASPIMLLGMKHPEITDMDELRKVGENFIKNELIRLEGIADVMLTGVEEKEVLIETEPYLLDAYSLTVDQVVQQVQSMNINVSGGTIVDMGKKYIIRGSNLVENLQAIENIIVSYKSINSSPLTAQQTPSLSDKVPVFLKEVAKVSYVNKPPQNIVRVNGVRCIGISIYKETGVNTVNAVKELKTALEKIKKTLPDYEFITVQNQGNFIQQSINEVEETALIGVIIAVFVLFIFLRRIKLTLIICFAIPISIVATFNLMYFNELSLNIMTLGGLALGAGMLVDNAIVVMENIFRNRELGLSVKEAAIQGTAEVGGAITASTLTTIVVFLPIVYLHGVSGALFKDQAWTVAFSLLASLFVAILVIPMLFNTFYKTEENKHRKEIKSVRIGWYGNLLSKIIEKRWLIIILTITLLIGTYAILPLIGSEYLPKSGSGAFSIDIKLKEGTQLNRTASTVTNIEYLIKESLQYDLDLIFSQIGPTSAGTSEKLVFQNENTASIKIKLKKEAINHSETIISNLTNLLEEIPDAEIQIIRDETALQSNLGISEAPLLVEIKGDEIDVLDELSNYLKSELSTIQELMNLKTSIEKGAPEIDVIIDRQKASMHNLNVENICTQLKDRLMGKSAGKYEKAGEMNDITLRMPKMSLYDFNNIQLKSGDYTVPLYEIAHIKESISPKQLHRRNQNRISKISADIKKGIAFDQVIEKVNDLISRLNIPQGYQIQVIGEEQKRQEALSNLNFALILSIVLVYMVMASQFESIIHPFTILLTIPLAGVGTVWAFFLLGKSLNIMAFIGIIMLAGIAVNDSIILVDSINKFKASGKSLKDAIISAGENRIRPIFMTSLTTILALLPLTIGFGDSAALRSPMAIAIIAGLVTSTLLTLVVIPCVYFMFESVKLKLKKQTVA